MIICDNESSNGEHELQIIIHPHEIIYMKNGVKHNLLGPAHIIKHSDYTTYIWYYYGKIREAWGVPGVVRKYNDGSFRSEIYNHRINRITPHRIRKYKNGVYVMYWYDGRVETIIPIKN